MAVPWRYQARCPNSSPALTSLRRRCPDFPPAPIARDQRSPGPSATFIIARFPFGSRRACLRQSSVATNEILLTAEAPRAPSLEPQVYLTITPLPLVFSQVFILKGVEVLCFDTVLQVLILNEIEEGSEVGEKRNALSVGNDVCARKPRDADEGMPPPVFCKKSPQAIENKGWGSEKERQEISRVGKTLRN